GHRPAVRRPAPGTPPVARPAHTPVRPPTWPCRPSYCRAAARPTLVSVDDDLLTTRVDALLTDLGSRRGVVVAFSGGVDSAGAGGGGPGPGTRPGAGRDGSVARPARRRTWPGRRLRRGARGGPRVGRDPRDRTGGLPRQRRQPLLLLQGRDGRGARPVGRRSRLGGGDRDERR